MADQFSILAFQHRLLQQKYGRSGAGKLPDSEALTAGEVLCLNFWGIEASGCKYLTSFFFFFNSYPKHDNECFSNSNTFVYSRLC